MSLALWLLASPLLRAARRVAPRMRGREPGPGRLSFSLLLPRFFFKFTLDVVAVEPGVLRQR